MLLEFASQSLNRTKHWQQLLNIGVSDKLLASIKSLYVFLTSCVHIKFRTGWFNVQCGLRQGCILSLLLFNLYIDDLTMYLMLPGIHVECDLFIC